MLLVIVVLLSQLVANMDRAAKLRRLDSSRRRLPYISAQALAAVYKDVLEHGVPDKRTRKDLIEAKKLVKEIKTPFGKLQQQLLVPKQNVFIARRDMVSKITTVQMTNYILVPQGYSNYNDPKNPSARITLDSVKATNDCVNEALAKKDRGSEAYRRVMRQTKDRELANTDGLFPMKSTKIRTNDIFCSQITN